MSRGWVGTGDDANGSRHLDVHGSYLRDLQQKDARVRDGVGGVPRHGREARKSQDPPSALASTGVILLKDVVMYCFVREEICVGFQIPS